MIVMFTARRLKPGSFEQFSRAFDGATPPPGMKQAYHARNIRDGLPPVARRGRRR
jgi:hypothetical protein